MRCSQLRSNICFHISHVNFIVVDIGVYHVMRLQLKLVKCKHLYYHNYVSAIYRSALIFVIYFCLYTMCKLLNYKHSSLSQTYLFENDLYYFSWIQLAYAARFSLHKCGLILVIENVASARCVSFKLSSIFRLLANIIASSLTEFLVFWEFAKLKDNNSCTCPLPDSVKYLFCLILRHVTKYFRTFLYCVWIVISNRYFKYNSLSDELVWRNHFWK